MHTMGDGSRDMDRQGRPPDRRPAVDVGSPGGQLMLGAAW
jgi:hypothetical protein